MTLSSFYDVIRYFAKIWLKSADISRKIYVCNSDFLFLKVRWITFLMRGQPNPCHFLLESYVIFNLTPVYPYFSLNVQRHHESLQNNHMLKNIEFSNTKWSQENDQNPISYCRHNLADINIFFNGWMYENGQTRCLFHRTWRRWELKKEDVNHSV